MNVWVSMEVGRDFLVVMSGMKIVERRSWGRKVSFLMWMEDDEERGREVER